MFLLVFRWLKMHVYTRYMCTLKKCDDSQNFYFCKPVSLQASIKQKKFPVNFAGLPASLRLENLFQKIVNVGFFQGKFLKNPSFCLHSPFFLQVSTNETIMRILQNNQFLFGACL